jgi:heme/copper-type cytochrome/quinol oxidase subunit 2
MNSNAYIVSGIIAFVFLVAKFIEMRFTNSNNNSNNNSNKSSEENEPKPLKFLVRDALLVYVSALLGFYIIAQFEEHAAVGSSTVKEVAAFTGGPDF